MSSPITTKKERAVLTVAAIIMFCGYVIALMTLLAMISFAVTVGVKAGWSVW